MSLLEFEQSAKFLNDYFRSLGFSQGLGQTLSIQYVGGEILTVPTQDLRDIVLRARNIFSEVFDNIIDGVQSNLIGSRDRLAGLVALFGKRIGTSVDHFGHQRKLSGSANKYRVFSIASAERLRKMHMPASAIFVVDKVGVKHLNAECELANKGGYPLTLRAVFDGGRSIDAASIEDLSLAYAEAFDAWCMKARVPVEPFMHLTVQRVAAVGGLAGANHYAGCPFQSDCAEVSLNLDPDGGLYICLDTSDSSQMRLGNALKGEFDWDLWARIKARSQHLDSSCRVCEYKNQCGGGCMSEGYALAGDPWAKTGLCSVWKLIFAKIDQQINISGPEKVGHWLKSLMVEDRSFSNP